MGQLVPVLGVPPSSSKEATTKKEQARGLKTTEIRAEGHVSVWHADRWPAAGQDPIGLGGVGVMLSVLVDTQTYLGHLFRVWIAMRMDCCHARPCL